MLFYQWTRDNNLPKNIQILAAVIEAMQVIKQKEAIVTKDKTQLEETVEKVNIAMIKEKQKKGIDLGILKVINAYNFAVRIRPQIEEVAQSKCISLLITAGFEAIKKVL